MVRTAVAPGESGLSPAACRSLILAGGVLLLLPLLVSAVDLVADVGDAYHPVGDHALTVLRTSDVGRHEVLVGPFSRDGWNHPGPALFYASAVPYRLSGGSPVSLAVGALAINGAALIGMALVARRVGGTALAVATLLGSALLVRALGLDFLRDFWNPYLPVLPFGLFVMLTWAMACGRAGALPVAAGVATFCVQTHIGFLPLAAPLLVLGAAVLLATTLHRRHDGEAGASPNRLRTMVLVTAAVLFVGWLPPLVQQVRGSPGNLGEALQYLVDSGEERHTLVEGARVVGAPFGPAPTWLTGDVDVDPFSSEPASLSSASLPVWLVGVSGAALILRRRRCAVGVRLVAVVVVAMVLGVLAVAGTRGLVHAYRLRWTWVLAMLAFVAAGWAGWLLVRDRFAWSRSAPVAGGIALVALAGLAGINTLEAAREGTPHRESSETMGDLIRQVIEKRSLIADEGGVLVHGVDFTGFGYANGLVLGLERRGVEVRVDEDSADAFGAHRAEGGGPVQRELTVATGETFDDLLAEGDRRLVAYSGSETLEERQQALAEVQRLLQGLEGRSVEEVFEAVEGVAPGSAVGVFTTR